MAGVIRTMPSHSGRSAPRLVKAPRPPNAWIIYRSDKAHQLPPLEPGQPRRAQAEVSKMISNMWANESEETRQEYERRAEEAKAAHALKYPGYRFKPMKKEEKKAQRELERDERQAQRRQQQRQKSSNTSSASPSSSSLSDRGVSAPPAAVPFTAPTTHFIHPSYYASMPTSVGASHMAAPATSNPYSLPFIPFFQSQTRFGPAGPTPPVSAAASPSEADTSPSPEATTVSIADDSHNIPSNDPTHVQAIKATTSAAIASAPSVADKATITPPAPRSVIQGALYPPAFDAAAFAAGQEWPHAAPRGSGNVNTIAISTNTGTLTPAMTPSPIWQNGDSKHTQEQQEQRQAAVTSTTSPAAAAASTASAQRPEAVSFDFTGFQLQNFEHLLAGTAPGDASSASSLSAFLTATTDPSVFRLDHLESSQIFDNPTREIEVSLGEFPPPDLSSFPTDLFNFGDPSTFGAGLDMGMGMGMGVGHGFSQTENSMQPQQGVFFHGFPGTQVSATATVDGGHDNNGTDHAIQFAYNPDEFLDFGNGDFQVAAPCSSMNGYTTPTTNTPPHTATSATAATGGGYTPPAGAANASYRRVGGTWNKQFVQAQAPSPPRSVGITHS